MRFARLSLLLLLPAALISSSGCRDAKTAATTPEPAPATACDGAQAPVAVAGPDRQVTLGATVTLEGTAFGATGAVTSVWRLEAIPASSQAGLVDASAAATTFAADVPGTYIASFTVRDACATSQADMVTILVPAPICAHAAPVASAGADQVINYRTTTYLNGSASHGSGTLSYRWSIESNPAGSAVMLQGASTATPAFYPDRSGNYVFSLVVNDGCQDSAADSVTYTVPNAPPTVYGGYQYDVPVLVPTSPGFSVYDADGDPLTYAWTFSSGPTGSAATFSNPTALNSTFTPDLPGSYTVTLAVNDGTATTSASMTIRAVDYPPVASAGLDRAAAIGEVVTLDGTASSDANKTPLAFAWTLASPDGSAATLSGADTARPSFTPDLAGPYVATLVVSSGGQQASDTITLAAWPAVRRLAHRIIDAEYSTALDRIVMVAADPQALYLLDPQTGDEVAVALSAPPTALSLAPDGRSAAVGHTGAVTVVDLVAATAVAPVTVSGTVGDLALGASGLAWYLPRPATYNEQTLIVSVPLDGSAGSWASTSFSGASRLKLRPGGAGLYLANGNSGSSLAHYDVAGATPLLVSSVSSGYYCNDIWFSEAGSRLFNRCGAVFLASSSLVEDLTPAGTLVRTAYASITIQHLADSTPAGKLSAITSADSGYYSGLPDQVLRSWSATDLTPLEAAPLPSEVIAGITYRWGGRFVFYRSDGSARYVLMQLDPTSGVLQDYGWVTF
jgi:hypothetical protein